MPSKSSSSIFDLSTGRVGATLPQLVAAVMMLFAGFVAYTELATKGFVNEKHRDVTGKIGQLADAQTASANQVRILAEQNAKTDKRMGLIVRLVSAAYVEQVDVQEGSPRRRRSSGAPRSRKADAVAKALKVDPDDPLAGLELTEMLDQ